MDQRACSPASNSLRGCCTCTQGQGICNGEVVTISTPQAHEIFIRCAPITASGTSAEQAKKFYDCLPRLLSENGAQVSDVLWERVFFRNAAEDFDTFSKAREAAYAQYGITGDDLPVATYIEQPPCRHDQAFELQVYVVVAKEVNSVRVQSFPMAEGTTAKVIEIGDFRHLYITNINGLGSDGKPQESFREQCDAMWEKAGRLMERHGTEFPKVLRTWCYLDDIDRDYNEFNVSRNEFFERHNVRRLPASTGIRAGLYPPGTLCGTDLYALLNPEGVDVEVMHTPTLNEAADYGSAFSRGMKVGFPEKTVLFVSGTASVDESGATVHLSHVRRQVERMLLNIQELLKPHGATFADVAQIITYLKWRDETELFLQIWDEWGLSGLPNTFVEAGVCRPNLLCEMEAVAIVPTQSSSPACRV
ncbi:MAG: Rid family hydrolase [Pirellulaceae bacterium]